ncbi:MAG: UDP-2,3-diacylglucosamine diphosphatase LpxI [Rhizobiaceae bacterium]|nr:UDP-2,3-diacylglucosamine diphosphatase LpxI [Rhizobiaceae bacterium]
MTTKAETAGIELSDSDRVAVIAGSGRLPEDVAAGLAEAGRVPLIVMIAGEAREDGPLAAYPHEVLALERVGHLFGMLRRHGVTHAVMAGGVSRRPDWRAVRLTPALLGLMPSLIRALMKGDDHLLRALVAAIEKRGVKVIGAHDIVPDLLTAVGPLTKRIPSQQDRSDMEAAWIAAQALGALDVGQAAVAIGGRAVALEDIEGTDRLLERVASFRGHGRLARKTGGVLVKCAKPGQELRADLPTIGPLTIEAVHRAGLAGIGLEAGRSLILDRNAVVAAAERLGVFVYGLDGGQGR